MFVSALKKENNSIHTVYTMILISGLYTKRNL